MSEFFLIDGYNLLYALGMLDRQVKKSALEKARQQLLDFLKDAFGDDASCVTIVFDAKHAPGRVPHQQTYHGIHILFAAGQHSADDLIETMIQEHDQPDCLVVVSNDSRLQQAARRCGAAACKHTDLLDLFDKRARGGKPKTTPAPDDKQTGQLSEKEKEHWMKEFGGLETDPELKEFFDMDRFDDEPPAPL